MSTKDTFNEAGRVEEQKEIQDIKSNPRKSGILEDIRVSTEGYLRESEQLKGSQTKGYEEQVNKRYLELVQQRGTERHLLPPGMVKDLKEQARADITNQQNKEIHNLKGRYETEVRGRIGAGRNMDQLEQRGDQYAADRDAWVAQRGNVVEQMKKATTLEQTERYNQMLECVDRSWDRTIERHFDTGRDRGVTPEFSRSANDIGRGQ